MTDSGSILSTLNNKRELGFFFDPMPDTQQYTRNLFLNNKGSILIFSICFPEVEMLVTFVEKPKSKILRF